MPPLTAIKTYPAACATDGDGPETVVPSLSPASRGGVNVEDLQPREVARNG